MTTSKDTAQKTTKTKVASVEPTYTYQELVEQAKALGERPEVLAGALLPSGKKEFTKTEVQSLLKQFKTKDVK